MQLSELDYSYPERLIATQPHKNFRILISNEQNQISEITKSQLFNLFQGGDGLIVNETRVLKRRVFAHDGMGILFISCVNSQSESAGLEWQVLFGARDYKLNQKIELPKGVTLELLQKGIPQIVRSSEPLTDEYFAAHGEFALPPYIQKARGSDHNTGDDEKWYQAEWAKEAGSCAAPTASLHFSNDDLTLLKDRGVEIIKVTLHVGIGTFLPIKANNLNDHQMHKEWAFISPESAEKIKKVKESGHKIWALGTTVARTLESHALHMLAKQSDGSFAGETDLFIRPGFEWQTVDRLLTNFHQPKSTLISLVASFKTLEHIKAAYQSAIEKEFRLFSYGDLSVWIK